MEVQAALGSEIVMAFDECLPGDVGRRRNAQEHGVDAAMGETIEGNGSQTLQDERERHWTLLRQAALNSRDSRLFSASFREPAISICDWKASSGQSRSVLTVTRSAV